MKRLAYVVFQLAPDLRPRIDAFAPTPGMPAEAVVVDVYEGDPGVLPGVRIAAWPSGSTWRAVKIVYEADSLDVRDIADFDDQAHSDASAPRWLFGAVVAFLEGVFLPALLDAFEVDLVEDLPGEAKAIAGPLWLKAARMRMIYES